MQGLAAGLAALEGEVGAAYISACDVPLLRQQFVRRVISSLGDHFIAVQTSGKRVHPLAAVYRTEVADTAKWLLSNGRHRLTELFKELPTRFLPESHFADIDPNFFSLRNVNTPEDYLALLQIPEFADHRAKCSSL